jgi:DNA-directed RNA polymerase specialized sigma24 family protein
VLNQRFPLHDIRDVEAFCEGAISRSRITEFGYLDHDDLLSELIAFCWQLSERYDKSRASFSSFAGTCLYNFIIEWKRSDFRTRWTFGDGRVYERTKPVFVEYDGAVGETAVDPVERGDTDSERMDAEGSIGAAAYLPPARFRIARGTHGASGSEADSKHRQSAKAAA